MCKNRLSFCFLFVLIASLSYSQSKLNQFLTPSDSLNESRRKAVIITESSLVGISLIGLDQLWYNDFERSKFHTLNDSEEWLQMDKAGHVFTAYQMSRLGADVLNWSGVSEKNQLIYGITLGFGFLTAVEVFDGFSKEWGFSWGDMLANGVGVGLFVGQELLWKDQRIVLKYSFHQTKYAAISPDKLGENFLEELLKDYNGQTYWLSFNIHSFLNKESKVPKWLNIALGYSGERLVSGIESANNNQLNYNRYRQFLFSLDIDLSKIKTESRALKSLFSVCNAIKIPFPAFEFNNQGNKFHFLYF